MTEEKKDIQQKSPQPEAGHDSSNASGIITAIVFFIFFTFLIFAFYKINELSTQQVSLIQETKLLKVQNENLGHAQQNFEDHFSQLLEKQDTNIQTQYQLWEKQIHLLSMATHAKKQSEQDGIKPSQFELMEEMNLLSTPIVLSYYNFTVLKKHKEAIKWLEYYLKVLEESSHDQFIDSIDRVESLILGLEKMDSSSLPNWLNHLRQVKSQIQTFPYAPHESHPQENPIDDSEKTSPETFSYWHIEYWYHLSYEAFEKLIGFATSGVEVRKIDTQHHMIDDVQFQSIKLQTYALIEQAQWSLMSGDISTYRYSQETLRHLLEAYFPHNNRYHRIVDSLDMLPKDTQVLQSTNALNQTYFKLLDVLLQYPFKSKHQAQDKVSSAITHSTTGIADTASIADTHGIADTASIADTHGIADSVSIADGKSKPVGKAYFIKTDSISKSKQSS